MQPEVIVGERAELARRFVADLERELRAAGSRRRFTLAVPGGSVAETFFPYLAGAAIDWTTVEVFWTDERAVPPTAAESNFALASRLWLVPAGVPASHVHRMPAESADRGAADGYAAALHAAAGRPPTLDYVLLGVGADGHVASVFPDDLPDERAGPVAWTERAPKPPARRLTLTLATLARARRVAVAALDQSKAPAIDAALSGRGTPTPLGALLGDTARPLLLLDASIGATPGPSGHRKVDEP